MKLFVFLRLSILLVFGSSLFTTHANSVGFDAADYQVVAGQIVVTVTYDFSELAMSGGGVDLIYDPSFIEFVSYTQAQLADDVWSVASPVGSLVAPGLYQGPGIGSFPFFSGITSSGEIGAFVFNFLSVSANPDTPCGNVMCLVQNSFNPFVSLSGDYVGDEVLADGISSANVAPVPVPAAVWLLLSGLTWLLVVDRTNDARV